MVASVHRLNPTGAYLLGGNGEVSKICPLGVSYTDPHRLPNRKVAALEAKIAHTIFSYWDICSHLTHCHDILEDGSALAIEPTEYLLSIDVISIGSKQFLARYPSISRMGIDLCEIALEYRHTDYPGKVLVYYAPDNTFHVFSENTCLEGAPEPLEVIDPIEIFPVFPIGEDIFDVTYVPLLLKRMRAIAITAVTNLSNLMDPMYLLDEMRIDFGSVRGQLCEEGEEPVPALSPPLITGLPGPSSWRLSLSLELEEGVVGEVVDCRCNLEQALKMYEQWLVMIANKVHGIQ